MALSSMTSNSTMTEDDSVDVEALKALVEQTGSVIDESDGDLLFGPEDATGYENRAGCYAYRIVGCKERSKAVSDMIKSGTIAPLIEMYLLSIADADGRAFISREDLMKEFDCSRTTLYRGLKVLQDVGDVMIDNYRADGAVSAFRLNPDWFKFRKAD